MKFLNQNGIFLPEQLAKLPDEIGFGCPKCDLCQLVPISTVDTTGKVLISAFLSKHQECGDLEALEKKGDRITVKGIKQA
jgi:hypothetical protein